MEGGSLRSLFAEFAERTMHLTEEDEELYELESLICDLEELIYMATESNQIISCLDDLKAYKRQVFLEKYNNSNGGPDSGVVQAGPKQEQIESTQTAQIQDTDLESQQSKTSQSPVKVKTNSENNLRTRQKSIEFFPWRDAPDDIATKQIQGNAAADPRQHEVAILNKNRDLRQSQQEQQRQSRNAFVPWRDALDKEQEYIPWQDTIDEDMTMSTREQKDRDLLPWRDVFDDVLQTRRDAVDIEKDLCGAHPIQQAQTGVGKNAFVPWRDALDDGHVRTNRKIPTEARTSDCHRRGIKPHSHMEEDTSTPEKQKNTQTHTQLK